MSETFSSEWTRNGPAALTRIWVPVWQPITALERRLHSLSAQTEAAAHAASLCRSGTTGVVHRSSIVETGVPSSPRPGRDRDLPCAPGRLRHALESRPASAESSQTALHREMKRRLRRLER